MFNREAMEDKIARLDLKNSTFNGFLDYIMLLREEVGIAHTIKEIGIEDDSKFSMLAEMAVVDPTAGGNPIPLKVGAVEKLYRRALSGELGR